MEIYCFHWKLMKILSTAVNNSLKKELLVALTLTVGLNQV